MHCRPILNRKKKYALGSHPVEHAYIVKFGRVDEGYCRVFCHFGAYFIHHRAHPLPHYGDALACKVRNFYAAPSRQPVVCGHAYAERTFADREKVEGLCGSELVIHAEHYVEPAAEVGVDFRQLGHAVCKGHNLYPVLRVPFGAGVPHIH